MSEVTPRDIAVFLSAAVPPDTNVSSVIIGSGAFLTAVILRHYRPEARQQIVENFANMLWQMVLQAQEGEDAREAATRAAGTKH